MKNISIRTLNQLNSLFYESYSQSFDQSRSHPWQGWARLKPLFEQLSATNGQLKVLDLGCGNARFASWLNDNQIPVGSYLGIDQSSKLLQAALDRTRSINFDCKLKKVDLIEALIKDQVLSEDKFDVIVIFGVLHHVPSKKLRAKLIMAARHLLTPGGLLCFSNWKFKNLKNLMSRARSLSEAGIIDDAEAGDYLLDWQREAGDSAKVARYCHLVESGETKRWLRETRLTLELSYNDDGPDQNTNHYLVYRK